VSIYFEEGSLRSDPRSGSNGDTVGVGIVPTHRQLGDKILN
jgi:hypothetical protein